MYWEMDILIMVFPPCILMVLESALGWYQGRISHYDKQSWEITVEQRILQGLSYTPRKTAKLKTELIDVDLVRGSTFPKAKPQSGIWLAGLHGISRIILLPFYASWWIRETSCTGFFVVLSVYSSILMSGIIMFCCRNDEVILKDIPASEVLLPCVVILVLSVIHSQIVCTRHTGISSPNHSRGPVGIRHGRRMRSLRRSVSLKGRGKCACSSARRDNTRLSVNPPKKHNRSPFKTFRSHSEEPKHEEVYPLRPRSASENNVAPCVDSKGKPSIIIFSSGSSQNIKADEQSSSSATTSSSDRSPVAGIVEGKGEIFIDQLKKKRLQEFCPDDNGIDDANTPLDGSDGRQCRDKEILVDGCRTESCLLKSKCEGKNSLLQTPGTEDIAPSIHLKLPSERPDVDGGSDGGEESGMGDFEGPTTDTDSWNMKKTARRSWCSCSCGKPSDTSASHPSRRSPHKLLPVAVERSSCNSSCESDAEQSPSPQYTKAKHSEYEWMGITTNSDDLSYSSESDGGWDDNEESDQTFLRSEALDWNIQGSPAAIITSAPNVSDKVSCKIWEEAEVKKVDLSVLDISSAVISKVDSLHHTTHYLQFGLTIAIVIALVPSIYRVDYSALGNFLDTVVTSDSQDWIPAFKELLEKVFTGLLGGNMWSSIVILLSAINRLCLAGGFFFLLSVAERTFKQRFLYAKHFCYLTSARRARKYDLPHFRLNKVHNIKTWLSVRSCLKKRGPQRSVDVIVSATFFITLLLVSYLCFELLKEDDKSQHTLYNCELFFWCFAIGIYLIRFMTLGAMINKKYSSLSVLITEQINMYLHMEQKPQKKDELMLANNVLKLVSVLLKELESPFKISGLSANPLLYNITRLVVLSACSGVLSDLLGFKLKLHKIKFKE
nr:putative homeodomain transcription factor [Penaeus vannamei]